MSTDVQIGKWYFGVNQAGLENCAGLIKAAVASCLANTALQPHCLYFGSRNPTIEAIERMGVHIIPHIPTLQPELQIGYGAKYKVFAGHWLRTDLPLIETEDQFILYTDIDVLFLRWDPALLLRPTYLAVAPEHRIEDTSRFNSGVMILNLENMRAELGAFHAAIRKRLLGDFKYPNHDQQSFNDHFRGRYDQLSPLMNWKPYWGRNDHASIVHFHGPKPHNVQAIKAGVYQGKEGLVTIWKRNPAAYDYYCDLWKKYALLAARSARQFS